MAMSEHKFTPGPWKTAADAGVNNALFHGIVATLAHSPECWIAVVAPEHTYRPMREEELEANARLIAAAPDLLSVALVTRELLKSIPELAIGSSYWKLMNDAITAAIGEPS